ncbi:ParB N-terminal domain-containing protein [uncultured Roseobacter sp.]|uniref:ParB N-terminal domain-containing protein n=1 Tax=uncultured Roseobacter sp. TaxID=114847 RepID=UPI002609091A|nr:ParB N-terminal domain-containing protein [uncultured Roseobacter sp.]
MLEKLNVSIDKIRVPSKRAKALDEKKLELIAEDMIEKGQTTPIQVRIDGDGYVLIEGLHRLEALRALGEANVEAYIVRARLH